MKTTFTFALLVFTAIAFAQIPNASFETWSGGQPTGWTTNNSVASGAVTETNDTYQGDGAAELNVVGATGGVLSATFAVSGIPDTLYGWYQGNFGSLTDFFLVTGTIKSANGTVLATINDSIKNAEVEYTRFAIKYAVTGSPSIGDSATITFSLADGSAPLNAGTSIIIDDLYFGAIATAPNGIAPVTSNTFSLNCMPNPATNAASIIFNLNSSSNVSLALYDVAGNKVKTLLDNTQLSNGQYKLPVDVTSLANGMYLYTLVADGQQYTQKMVVAK